MLCPRMPVLALLSCFLLALPLRLEAQADSAPAGVVDWLGPGVWVQVGSERGRKLKPQENVFAGETLRTSRGSGLEIRFYQDGVLALRESTRVTLADPQRAGVVSTVILDQGVLFLAHDPDLGPKEVEVRTRTASIRLKGTRILVTAEPGPEGATSVTVLDGGAEVTSLDKGKMVALGPGVRTRVEKGKGVERPWKADPGVIRLALELWKPGGPLLEGGELTDAVLLLVAPH